MYILDLFEKGTQWNDFQRLKRFLKPLFVINHDLRAFEAQTLGPPWAQNIQFQEEKNLAYYF